MKSTLLVFTYCLAAFGLAAQSSINFWNDVPAAQIALPENAEIDHDIVAARTLALDLDEMKNYLRQAPTEFTPEASDNPLMLELPMPNGETRTYGIREVHIMEPGLAERYPMVKTYAGFNLDKPEEKVRLMFGEHGFNATVFGKDEVQMIAPYAKGQTTFYAAFSQSDIEEPVSFVCGNHNAHEEDIMDEQKTGDKEVVFSTRSAGDPIDLKAYRLAMATTSEYSADHGGTPASVLSAVVNIMNQVNGMFENDHAIRMVLITTTDQTFFFTPNEQDPYTNGDSGVMLNENVQPLTNAYGLGAFDIGHVFGIAPGGGVVGTAALGSVCADNKAAGASNVLGPSTFYKIVAHEMGHQFNAPHTFNFCGTGNANPATGYEPGSGSCVMSYGNACGSNAVQPQSADYFHINSLIRIGDFTRDGGPGGTCKTIFAEGNQKPEVTIPIPDGFFIPISTPFELTGEATDEDGDDMTYNWEQYNLGPPSPLGSPQGNAPSFRSLTPGPSTMRVFPRMQDVLNNTNNIREVLPTYSRDLNFRFTARDNSFPAGAWDSEEIAFEATETAGPFLVTYPNTPDVLWKAGEQVEVTWDVANTDNAIVNCQSVNIKLSTDGGQSFPHLLASFTPNDGSELITVPDFLSDDVRIRIEASQNIFFDLSNENFEIGPADAPTYSMVPDPEYQQVCLPDNASVDVSIGAILGYDEPIQLEIIDGLPAGVEIEFSANPVMPEETTTLNFDMSGLLDDMEDSEFTVQLEATSASGTIIKAISFDNVYNDFTALKVEAPTNGQTNLGLLGEFEWTDLPQADLFDFQLATSPTFAEATIIDEAYGLTSANFDSEAPLEPSTIYYWRVRPFNARCGYSPFSPTNVFQTFYTVCDQFKSNDGPINISGSGLPVINSQIPVLQSGAISDLNITKIKGKHDALPDLKVTLRSPAGTEATLFEAICGNTSIFNFGMDDESLFQIDCPPLDGLRYIPQNPLSTFDGEDILGNWNLEVEVISIQGDGGELDEWGIEFCAAVNPQHPFLVENDTIYVQPSEERVIHNFELYADDPDNIGDDLIFTVVNETSFGYISKNGTPLGPGNKFKLTDINNQSITYTNVDESADYDFFTFHITDGAGGLLATPKFHIVIDDNAVTSTSENSFSDGIMLFPNPTSSQLTVAFPQPLAANATVLVSDIQGRMISQTEMERNHRRLTMDMSNLSDGIYFLTVRSEEGIFTKKFVVQK